MTFRLVNVAVVAVTVWVFSPAATALASGTLSLSGTQLTWTGTAVNDSLTVSANAQLQPFPNPPIQTITFRSPTTIGVAAPTGSNKCHQRKLNSSCSAFQETRTTPATTSRVPARVSPVADSLRTTMAMVALIRGLIDWSALLRDAPIFKTPV